jgi:hypothetical protein
MTWHKTALTCYCCAGSSMQDPAYAHKGRSSEAGTSMPDSKIMRPSKKAQVSALLPLQSRRCRAYLQCQQPALVALLHLTMVASPVSTLLMHQRDPSQVLLFSTPAARVSSFCSAFK